MGFLFYWLTTNSLKQIVHINSMKKSFLFALALIVLVGLCFGGCSKSTIEIILSKSEKKTVRINKIPIKKIGELMGELNAVFFSPDELKLIKERLLKGVCYENYESITT